MCDKSRNTWLCVHWQWNTLEWCQLNALQASPVVHLVTPLSCVSLSMNTQPSVPTLMKHTRVVSLNARQAKPGVHLVDTTRVCFIVNEHTTKCSCFYHTCWFKMLKVYSFMWWNMWLVSFESWELILQFLSSGLMKLDETIGYCWCPIVMKWSLWLQQWSLWLHHCDVIHWDKQSCVTMAVDL